MRKIRELLSVNDKGMSIVMLVVITILLPNTILRGLGIPSDTEACLYDVYIGIGIYYVSRLLTICSLFYILYVQRYNFSVMMITRHKHIYSIWKRCVKDLAILSAVIAVYIYIATTIAGICIKRKIYSWEDEASTCYSAIHMPCEAAPSFALISAVFILQAFAVIFVMGLIMLAVWWITDKKWAGYLAAMVIVSVEYYDADGAISTGLLWRKYVMTYSVYKKGILLGKNILMPIAVCIAMLLVTSLIVRLKKKEFINSR